MREGGLSRLGRDEGLGRLIGHEVHLSSRCSGRLLVIGVTMLDAFPRPNGYRREYLFGNKNENASILL
ncbi:hypothetical protein ACWEQG_18810 [Microbispora sp. NPDC004025]